MTGWLLLVALTLTPGHSIKTEVWFDTGPACQRAAEAVRDFHQSSSFGRAVALCIPVSGSLPDAQPQGDQ